MIYQQQILKTLTLIGLHANGYILEMLLVNFNPLDFVKFPDFAYPKVTLGTGTLERLNPSEAVKKAGFTT